MTVIPYLESAEMAARYRVREGRLGYVPFLQGSESIPADRGLFIARPILDSEQRDFGLHRLRFHMNNRVSPV